MKQLQNGIYTFNIGEKCWGEEANKNFKTLDELVKEVSENKNNHLILTNNVNENATNIQQPKTDLEDNISVTKKALQDQIDILINQIINLQYQVSNLSSVDEAQHAVLAGTATLAVTAATARKVEHSLTIGDIVFNGQEDKSIAIDGEPTENSLNLINSEAVYKALELKQDKATTLSGYNITDAYTKSEVDTNLDGKSNTDHTHDDKYYTKSEVDTNLDGKSNTDHNHDDKYYSKSEVDTNLDGKSNTDHTHDDKYYTKSEVDVNLDGKSNTDHTHDDKYYTKSEVDVNLDGKSNTDHTHDDKYYSKSEVDTNLDGKSNIAHNHDDKYYTNSEFATNLDAKSNTDHNHDDKYYTKSEVD